MDTLSINLTREQTDASPISIKQASYAPVYFESFIVALFVSLGPSKSIATIAPFIVLIWFIVRSHSGQVLQKILLSVFGFFILITAYYCVSYAQNLHFLLGNSIVSFITYSPFILILCLPNQHIFEDGYYLKYAKVLRYVILLEAVVGISQFILVKFSHKYNILPGDAVQGTISFFPVIVKDAGFGNQMYVINMTFFLIFFVPYVITYRKGYIALGIGLLSVMLAGVMHVFISVVWGFLFTMIFYRKNILFGDFFKVLSAVILALALLLPFQFIFPGIFRTASHFVQLYEDENSPKFEAINNVMNKLTDKYPSVYIIGLGPGQYSSRAGLMSSGRYLGVKTSLLPNTTSEPFNTYFKRTWEKYSTNTNRYGNSTMHRPFFSLLSIFSEFGIVGLLFFIAAILSVFFTIRKVFLQSKKEGGTRLYLSFGLGILVISLFFISLFENYLETTQAILAGVMLLKVFYSYLIQQGKIAVSTPIVKKY